METVSTLEGASGKTSRTIQNYLRLLMLPVEIKRAIVEEKISVSKGYLFTRYVGHPDLLPIFTLSMQRPMSKQELIACFEDGDGSEAQTISDDTTVPTFD